MHASDHPWLKSYFHGKRGRAAVRVSHPELSIWKREQIMRSGRPASRCWCLLAAFGFVIWFQNMGTAKTRIGYRIVFDGAVTGLRTGGNVNFNGIRIGEVVSVKIDDPHQVVAIAMVESKAPIRKDTLVGLEFQGLTGVAAISLKGGEVAAPPVPR